jgi:mono/diheme cytochrome c family protein
MRLFLLGFFLPLLVTGCVSAPAAQPAGNIDTADENSGLSPAPGRAAGGLLFAQTHCASCHGVTGGQVSANPKAPPFDAIVNVRGLTENSMKTWLRESHNYPEQMDFEIDAQWIDELAAYMLTLKNPDYRPPIQ